MNPAERTRMLPNYPIDRARDYMKAVKVQLQNEQAKYEEFTTLMNQFKAQRVDILHVIMAVKELLKEHPVLIQGFSIFFPGSDLLLEGENPEGFEDALRLIGELKMRLGDAHYKTFWDKLSTARDGRKPSHQIHQELSSVLRRHHDLRGKVMKYSPKDIPMELPHDEGPSRPPPPSQVCANEGRHVELDSDGMDVSDWRKHERNVKEFDNRYLQRKQKPLGDAKDYVTVQLHQGRESTENSLLHYILASTCSD